MKMKAMSKAASKKDSTKKSPPSATSGKPEKKQTKTDEKPIETVQAEAPGVDPEDLEDQEDEAAAATSDQGGNAAALAAATGNSTEMSASFKNFRHHPDMENFYRFIYENDLRHEALAIIEEIMIEKQQRKLGKGGKAQTH